MIKAIKEPLEIDKVIRNVLIKQSELSSSRVLNAASVRGQNLSKLIEEDTYTSLNLSDILIIFERVFNPNSKNNVVMEEEDDTITIYSSFYIKILIYGNDSPYIANKLRSRLLTRSVIDDLQESGVCVNNISNPEPMSEWLNETLWIRNDLTMEVSCRESFKKIDSDYEINELSGIIFKENKE